MHDRHFGTLRALLADPAGAQHQSAQISRLLWFVHQLDRARYLEQWLPYLERCELPTFFFARNDHAASARGWLPSAARIEVDPRQGLDLDLLVDPTQPRARLSRTTTRQLESFLDVGNLGARDLGELVLVDPELAIESYAALLNDPRFVNLTHVEVSKSNKFSQRRRVGAEIVSYLEQAPSHHQLASISLSSQRIGDRGAVQLASSRALPNLTALDLSDNQLTWTSLEHILTHPARSNLRVLVLDDNDFRGGRPPGTTPPTRHLELLSLSRCELDSATLDALARCLAATSVERLDLQGCDLSRLSVAELESFLTQVAPRRVDVRFARQGLAELAELVGSPSLTEVRILHQHVKLLRVLHDPDIHDIDLARARVDDRGVRLLVESGRLAGVRSLDLAGNAITDDGVRLLATADLSSLTRLDLSHNKLQSRVCAWHLAMAETVRDDSSIHWRFQETYERFRRQARAAGVLDLSGIRGAHHDVWDMLHAGCFDDAREVNLSGIPLSDWTVRELAIYENYKHDIRFDVSGAALDASTALALAATGSRHRLPPRFRALETFLSDPAITMLDLSGWSFDDAAIASLCRLEAIERVKLLDLRGSNMCDRWLSMLFASRALSELEVLQLRGTQVSDVGAFELVNNGMVHRLSRLDVRETSLTPIAQRVLVHSAPRASIRVDTSPGEEALTRNPAALASALVGYDAPTRAALLSALGFFSDTSRVMVEALCRRFDKLEGAPQQLRFAALILSGKRIGVIQRKLSVYSGRARRPSPPRDNSRPAVVLDRLDAEGESYHPLDCGCEICAGLHESSCRCVWCLPMPSRMQRARPEELSPGAAHTLASSILGSRWVRSHYPPIGDEGLRLLVGSRSARHVESLELPHNGVTPVGIRHLVSSPHIQRIMDLGLGWNALGDEGLMAIATSSKCDHMRTLVLPCNDITDVGLIALGEAPMMMTLRELDLRGNAISLSGFLAVLGEHPRSDELAIRSDFDDVSALLRGELVETLDLSRRRLDDRDVDTILGLPGLEHVTALDVRYNLLTAHGIERLVERTRSNHCAVLSYGNLTGFTRDTTLTLSSSRARSEQQLIELLDSWVEPRLLHLSLDGADVSDQTARRLAELESLAELRTLDLRTTSITDDGIRALLDSARLHELQRIGVPEHLARIDARTSGALSTHERASLLDFDHAHGVIEVQSTHEGREVSLSSCLINPSVMRQLVREIAAGPLSSLALEHVGLTDEHIVDLASAAVDARPRRLSLEGNPLTDDGLVAVSDAALFSEVASLSLRHVKVGEVGVGALMEQTTALARLDLMLHQPASEDTARENVALIRALAARARSIQHLELSHRCVDLDGLRALVDVGLARGLRSLGLGECSWLGRQSVVLLANAPAFRGLERLDISGAREIRAPSVRELLESDNARSLRELDLSNLYLGRGGVRELARATATCQLETLRLREVRVSIEELLGLLDAPWLSGLTYLDLRGFRFDYANDADVGPLSELLVGSQLQTLDLRRSWIPNNISRVIEEGAERSSVRVLR